VAEVFNVVADAPSVATQELYCELLTFSYATEKVSGVLEGLSNVAESFSFALESFSGALEDFVVAPEESSCALEKPYGLMEELSVVMLGTNFRRLIFGVPRAQACDGRAPAACFGRGVREVFDEGRAREDGADGLALDADAFAVDD